MTMHRRLYGRLLRSSAHLQQHFDRLGGTKDMKAFHSLLLRVALRPSNAANGSIRRIGASQYVIDAVEEGLCQPDGLQGVVRSAFRTPSPDAALHLSRAFEFLKFSNELSNVFERVYQPEPRNVDQAFSVGHIVYHAQLDMKCVIYGYDAQANEELFEKMKASHLDETQPYYHIICADGRFRYVGQSDLVICKGEAVGFLDAMKDAHPDSEGFRFANGVLFSAVSTDRLIPNPDLWRRFPDVDGRLTASGVSCVPLAPPAYEQLPIPQPNDAAAATNGAQEARPSLFSFLASLFSSTSENKKKVK